MGAKLIERNEKTRMTRNEFERIMKPKNDGIKEFCDWEDKVQEGYVQNYMPYRGGGRPDGGVKLLYKGLKDDIHIKACQNDIRMLLKEFGEGFSGNINITYKDGKVLGMKATIESIGPNSSEKDYEKLKEFIWDYGLIGHWKYDTTKKLYGEKLYRYADDYFDYGN